MRTEVAKSLKNETLAPEAGTRLTAAYPQLYCPRCGSYEIGLRQFDGSEAIWWCRDCAASFALDFPRPRRF